MTNNQEKKLAEARALLNTAYKLLEEVQNEAQEILRKEVFDNRQLELVPNLTEHKINKMFETTKKA